MTRLYKPYSPGTRHRSVSEFKEISFSKPEKHLTSALLRAKGRNHRGVITSRHRGGGHKRLYRKISFDRNKINLIGVVKSIQYDPNRNARIALISYQDGTKNYILHTRDLNVGSTVLSSPRAAIIQGHCLPLRWIPLGIQVHNVECAPGGGGKLVRAAGTMAQIIAKEKQYATIRLPSGEVRLLLQNCWATIGQVGNEDSINQMDGKAGVTRWKGRRPKVRGSVMNPCDHPHGGGEGRCPIGRNKPVSIWGQPALGGRNRKTKKYSTNAIIKRRKGF